MKISPNQFKNTSDFEGRTGRATVNMDKMSLHIGNMISNYNFPELAVLREWVSNAHDAHVAAGVKRAVKVTLPSQLNPTLVVQDFGHGMTTDFVENVYLSFGSSTKDDSNDEIGGFGQGGKSALAIASQYTMTTIANGLKSVYIFERSPLGGVDFKLVIEEVPTDEPSGVTVQVAVDRVDQYNDVNLNRVLAGWSNEAVELNTKKKFFSIPDNGVEVEFEVDFTKPEDRNNGESDIRPAKGYVLNGAFDITGASEKLGRELGLGWSEHVVLVGPVAYIFQPEIKTNRVLNDYMVASVNIGDVSFPSSREVVEASASNRRFVGLCFEKIVDQADELLQLKADTLSDRQTALSLHRSPLAQNRSDFKIRFKGELIPVTFEPKTEDSIFEYQHTGTWRGVKGYKLAERATSNTTELKLQIQTLVVLDDDSSIQSVRNNVRIRHTANDDKPKDLGGFLVVSKAPSAWLKAAATAVVTSSTLAVEAKTYRKEQRDAIAAAAASGNPLPSTVPVRKTRKDRIGEYSAGWLVFGKDAEGNFSVTNEVSNLMDFFTNHFDPKGTLVLTTNGDFYDPANFTSYFQKFSVNPASTQFLRVHTGSKIETLRVLLGEDVKITDLTTWMKENFSKQARYNGRSPLEIAQDLPVSIDSAAEALIKAVGIENLHPKYAEILNASAELAAAQSIISERYYDETARFVRSLMSDFSGAKVESRPEFFFLEGLSYYRYNKLSPSQASAIRTSMNQMVEHWLDNLALEEAEAEEAAEKAEKAEAADSVSKSAALSN